MATTKRPADEPQKQAANRTRHDALYDEAVREFSRGVELLHKGEFVQAKEHFDKISASPLDEPALAERARTYSRICDRRLAPAGDDPSEPDGQYHRAVVLANEGRYDDALILLNRALDSRPDAAPFLYARASVWALKGDADSAVADLRRTIALDPKVRFQAVNDPDFERIREEPSFIDIIEPTPSEA